MMRHSPPAPRGCWPLRLALRLYPHRFRTSYGTEVLSVFSDRRAHVRRRDGRWAVLRLWIRALTDLVAGAPGEWLRERRRYRHAFGPPADESTKGDPIMSSIVQDARLALRTLFRQPGFATIAVATLALGIGANTAIFSLVNTVLLKPLPFPDSNELVRIWSSSQAEGRDRYFTSPLSFWEWQERTESFQSIAASWARDVTFTDDVNTPFLLRTESVTANWFEVLGATPHLGRTLQPADANIPWQQWVLVLTYGVWQDRFGGDPSVIGRSVRIDGQPAEIIGVLQPGAAFPESAELFTNFRPPRTQSAMYLDIIARTTPGAEFATAVNDLRGVARNLSEEFPDQLEGWSVDAAPLFEVVVGDVRPALLTMMVATGLVLAIACANVANLLLARTERRHRELALRSALGAGRRRLMRQLLTESVVLGGLGAVAGIAVAMIGLRTLVGIVPASLPRFDGVGLDLAMFGVALASALVTGVAFGLAPALQLLRVDLQSELKEGGQRTTGGGRRVQMRDAFVVAQMALAVVVSIGAGLLIKSFANLRNTDPGFSPTGVLTFELNLPTGSYGDLSTVSDTYRDILDRVRALPGVRHAGATSSVPLSEPLDYLIEVAVVGAPRAEPGTEPHGWHRQVSPGFFEAAGVTLVRGRAFDDRDDVTAPGVVLVNRSLARTLFGESDPVGQRLRGASGNFGPMGAIINGENEIVGVVDDVRYGSLREPAAPSVYFPLEQAPFRRMTITVRTAGDPAALVPSVRQEVAGVDPNLPLSNVTTLDDTLGRSIARDRFAMLLVGLFGAVALTLAAVGIYGVLSYSVAQRTQELGVRIALGASGSRVLSMVMRHTAILVSTGIGIGIVGASLTTRAISSQLYGVTARDPVTFVVVAVLLGAVGGVASYLPAFRATRISPLTALRSE